MKSILCILLVCISFVFAQKDNTKLEDTYSKFQIGLIASPDIDYRFLTTLHLNPSSHSEVNFRDQNEVAKLGYTFGMNACINFTKNIGLEFGFHYSNKGFETKFIDVPKSPYPLYTSDDYMYKIINHAYYTDIPLKVNYYSSNKKMRFIGSIGLIANVFWTSTQTNYRIEGELSNSGGKLPNNVEFSRANISPTISCGIDYRINQRMSLRLEPNFRCMILKNGASDIYNHLYSIGLNMCFYFGFYKDNSFVSSSRIN